MIVTRSEIAWLAVIFTLLPGLSGCESRPKTPPEASFTVSSQYTDAFSILEFDASPSTDNEDPSLALSFRWDFEDDGAWDTPFSRLPRNSNRYGRNGLFKPVLEVMDQDGMTDTCSLWIRITDVRKDSSITDPRDGRPYRVVLIEDVWWMAENLDFGVTIKSSGYPANNGTAEKYYYNDSDSVGKLYGGLYTWEEAMDYQTESGSQGICPPGWQIPAGRYVAALWDLVLFPFPDHKAYLGKGGYLGIDLEKSGTFNIYGHREFDSVKGGFWMSEHLDTGIHPVPYYFVYINLLYINRPAYDPPAPYASLSVRCVKPVK
jgi:hypothetical protein